MHPLVSFVTVTYNDGEGTTKTIESVKTQGVRFEHIIVDGGSDKNHIDLINRAVDERHLFESKKDRGIYDAMNKGIDKASGDFIVIINAGDTLTKEYVKSAVDFLVKNHEYDITYGGITGKCTNHAINDSFFLYHFNINHQSFVARSCCYKQDGRFSLNMLVASDIQWTQNMLRAGRRFHYLGDNVLTFEPGGTSSNERLRATIIQENRNLIRTQFPFLSDSEAYSLYMLRFSPQYLEQVLRIIRAHEQNHPRFIQHISSYLHHLLEHEKTYRTPTLYDYSKTPSSIIEACNALDINSVAIANPFFTYHYKQAKKIIRAVKKIERKYIVHYVYKYGAPTETFIRELISSLDNYKKNTYTHIILCDAIEKEYEASEEETIIHIPYQYMSSCLTHEIYQDLFSAATLCISHFSINSYKLISRLDAISTTLPFLHMLHGIDVFEMFRHSKDEYTKAILRISRKPNHLFTAPSEYLKNKAIEAGIPSQKISVIANSYRSSINKQRSRSIKQWSIDSGVLKILSLGRMIPWKGHLTLAKALNSLGSRFEKLQIEWTNISGGTTDTLAEVEDLIRHNNIQNIKFNHISYVDIDRHPEIFSEYDLFIQPSEYDTIHPGKPTETFGVSVLEAIVCGLPVIISDAGGIPELLYSLTSSKATNNFRIFTHGNHDSLAFQIENFITAPSCGKQEIARSTIAQCYSPSQRNEKLLNLIALHDARFPRVAIITTQTNGGAGGAAYRFWKSTEVKLMGYDLIVKGERRDRSLFYENHDRVMHASSSVHDSNLNLNHNTPSQYKTIPDHTIYSVDEQHLSIDQLTYIAERYDIVNLHWTARFISRSDIAFLTRNGVKVVITARDMQHLSGGCHYFHGCEKFNSSCECCPQFHHVSSDYAQNAMIEKVTTYNHSAITYVFLSKHNFQLLHDSRLVRYGSNSLVIPNGFSRSEIIPVPSKTIDHFIPGIPKNKVKTILFLPSFTSSVKGNSILESALNFLDYRCSELLRLVVVRPSNLLSLNLPQSIECHYIDSLPRKELIDLYAVVDFVIVPSTEETFSNTCAEALICGTPVIGCPTGAIPEMIVPGVTGEISADFSPAELANAIERALASEYDKKKCRNHVLDNFSQISTILKYQKLFESIYNSMSTLQRKTDKIPGNLDLFSLRYSRSAQFPVMHRDIGTPKDVLRDDELISLNKPLKGDNADLFYIDTRDKRLKLYRKKFNVCITLGCQLNLENCSSWGISGGKIFIQSETSKIILFNFPNSEVFSSTIKNGIYYLLRDSHIVARYRRDNKVVSRLSLLNYAVL